MFTGDQTVAIFVAGDTVEFAFSIKPREGRSRGGIFNFRRILWGKAHSKPSTWKGCAILVTDLAFYFDVIVRTTRSTTQCASADEQYARSQNIYEAEDALVRS